MNQSDPTFFWLFLLYCIFSVIVLVISTFYADRILAYIVTVVLRLYLWPSDKAYITIESVKFALLGGRILFKKVVYQSTNQKISILNGHLAFRYWLSHGPQENHGRRVVLYISGVEWFVYNRTPGYDYVEETLNNLYGAQRSDDDNSQHSINLSDGLQSAETGSMLQRLLPLDIQLYRGAIIVGNSSLKCLLALDIQNAKGSFRMTESRSALDRGKYILEVRVLKPKLQLKTNYSYHADKPFDNIVLRNNEPGIFVKAFYFLTDILHTPRSLPFNLNQQLANADSQPVFGKFGDGKANTWGQEYARVPLVLDSKELQLRYYWDSVGIVPLSNQQLNEKSSMAEIAPEWGVDLKFKESSLNYGPWADKQRTDIQSFFYPYAYHSVPPTTFPTAGQSRIFTNFQIHVEMLGDLTWKLPFREVSKDLGGKGNDLSPQSLNMSNFLQTIAKSYSWLELKLFAGARFNINVPYIIAEGSETDININCNSVSLSSSINQSTIFSGNEMKISFAIPYPIIWNSLHLWKYHVSFASSYVSPLADNIALINDFILDWNDRPAGEIVHFIPYEYKLDIDFGKALVHFYVTQNNILSFPLSSQDNTVMQIDASKMVVDLTICADQPNPISYETSYCIRLCDTATSLIFAQSDTNRAFFNTENVNFCTGNDLSVRSSFSFFHKYDGVEHDDIKDVYVNFSSWNINLHGIFLKYVMCFYENYLGNYVNFISVDEYRSRILQNSDSGSLQPTGQTFQMDYTMSAVFESTTFLFPLNIYSLYSRYKMRSERMVIDFQVTKDLICLQMNCFDAEIVPITPKRDFEEYIAISGFSLSVYENSHVSSDDSANSWVCDTSIQKIVGECSLSCINDFTQYFKCLMFQFRDEDNENTPYLKIVDSRWSIDVELREFLISLRTIDSSVVSNCILQNGVSLSLDNLRNHISYLVNCSSFLLRIMAVDCARDRSNKLAWNELFVFESDMLYTSEPDEHFQRPAYAPVAFCENSRCYRKFGNYSSKSSDNSCLANYSSYNAKNLRNISLWVADNDYPFATRIFWRAHEIVYRPTLETSVNRETSHFYSSDLFCLIDFEINPFLGRLLSEFEVKDINSAFDYLQLQYGLLFWYSKKPDQGSKVSRNIAIDHLCAVVLIQDGGNVKTLNRLFARGFNADDRCNFATVTKIHMCQESFTDSIARFSTISRSVTVFPTHPTMCIVSFLNIDMLSFHAGTPITCSNITGGVTEPSLQLIKSILDCSYIVYNEFKNMWTNSERNVSEILHSHMTSFLLHVRNTRYDNLVFLTRPSNLWRIRAKIYQNYDDWDLFQCVRHSCADIKLDGANLDKRNKLSVDEMMEETKYWKDLFDISKIRNLFDFMSGHKQEFATEAFNIIRYCFYIKRVVMSYFHDEVTDFVIINHLSSLVRPDSSEMERLIRISFIDASLSLRELLGLQKRSANASSESASSIILYVDRTYLRSSTDRIRFDLNMSKLCLQLSTISEQPFTHITSEDFRISMLDLEKPYLTLYVKNVSALRHMQCLLLHAGATKLGFDETAVKIYSLWIEWGHRAFIDFLGSESQDEISQFSGKLFVELGGLVVNCKLTSLLDVEFSSGRLSVHKNYQLDTMINFEVNAIELASPLVDRSVYTCLPSVCVHFARISNSFLTSVVICDSIIDVALSEFDRMCTIFESVKSDYQELVYLYEFDMKSMQSKTSTNPTHSSNVFSFNCPSINLHLIVDESEEVIFLYKGLAFDMITLCGTCLSRNLTWESAKIGYHNSSYIAGESAEVEAMYGKISNDSQDDIAVTMQSFAVAAIPKALNDIGHAFRIFSMSVDRLNRALEQMTHHSEYKKPRSLPIINTLIIDNVYICLYCLDLQAGVLANLHFNGLNVKLHSAHAYYEITLSGAKFQSESCEKVVHCVDIKAAMSSSIIEVGQVRILYLRQPVTSIKVEMPYFRIEFDKYFIERIFLLAGKMSYNGVGSNSGVWNARLTCPGAAVFLKSCSSVASDALSYELAVPRFTIQSVSCSGKSVSFLELAGFTQVLDKEALRILWTFYREVKSTVSVNTNTIVRTGSSLYESQIYIRIKPSILSLQCSQSVKIAAKIKTSDITLLLTSSETVFSSDFVNCANIELSLRHEYAPEECFNLQFAGLCGLSGGNCETNESFSVMHIVAVRMKHSIRQLQDALIFWREWSKTMNDEGSFKFDDTSRSSPNYYIFKIETMDIWMDLTQSIGSVFVTGENMIFRLNEKDECSSKTFSLGLVETRSEGRLSGVIANLKNARFFSFTKRNEALKYPYHVLDVTLEHMFTLLDFNNEHIVVLDIFQPLFSVTRNWNNGETANLEIQASSHISHIHGILSKNSIPCFLKIHDKIMSIVEEKYLMASKVSSTEDDGLKFDRSSVFSEKDRIPAFALYSPGVMLPILPSFYIEVADVQVSLFKNNFAPHDECLLIRIEKFECETSRTREIEATNRFLNILFGGKTSIRKCFAKEAPTGSSSQTWSITQWNEHVMTRNFRIILEMPQTRITLETSQKLHTRVIDFVLDTDFSGPIDVNLNFGFFKFLQELAGDFGEEVESSIRSLRESLKVKRIDNQNDDISSEKSSSKKNHEFLNEDAGATVVFRPLKPTVLEPQLKVIDGATPSDVLRWLGIHKDSLPSNLHKSITVPLEDVLDFVGGHWFRT